MSAAVLTGIIIGLCALPLIGIGVFQYTRKDPVGFYSGVKAPQKEELTDVKAWNRKHGVMWILYGLCILLLWGCGAIMGQGLHLLFLYLIGFLLPIPFMVLYHGRLVKKYMRSSSCERDPK